MSIKIWEGYNLQICRHIKVLQSDAQNDSKDHIAKDARQGCSQQGHPDRQQPTQSISSDKTTQNLEA